MKLAPVTLVLALVAAGSLAQDPAAGADAALRDRWKKRRLSEAEQLAELAQWAMDQKLYREAGFTAREVVRVVPDHKVGAIAQQLQKIDRDTYVRDYRAANRTAAEPFQAKRKKIAEAFAKDAAALATEAERAKADALAEEMYVEAFRADPTNKSAAKALKQRDYDLIFNYGTLPKEQKDTGRKLIKRLGGDFLDERDLKKELKVWTDAWGLSTRHYRLATNASADSVFQFAQACEDFYDGWGQLMKELGLPVRELKDRCAIQLFDTTITFEAILRASSIEPPTREGGVLGFYDTGSRVGYFFDDASFYNGDRGKLLETFFHEGSHQLYDLRLKVPVRGEHSKNPIAWIDEGVAVYVESLVVEEKGAERVVRFGTVLDDDLQAAIEATNAGKLPSLETYVHIDPEKFDKLELGQQQAAALVHFLMHAKDGAYKKAFATVVEESRKQGGMKQSMFELLGTTPAALDAAFRAYVKELPKKLPSKKYAAPAK